MLKGFLENSWVRCMSGLLLLMAIVLYPISVFTARTNAGLSYIFTSIIFAMPVLVGTLWLPKRWMFCVLASLLTIISIVELTMVDLYGSFLLPGGIISTIWTNPQEASEFYNTNIKEVYHWIPVILLGIVTCIVYQRPIFRKYGWVIGIFLLILPIAFITYKLNVFYKNNPITLRYYMDNRVWNRPPYNIFYALNNAHKLLEQRRMIANAATMRFGAHREKQSSQKEIYVLAIGESMRYDNLSLNGVYPRSTTPRLEQESNLVLFDNYYSQACLTMFSVPMLITRATPTNFELNYAERSIIEPFKECGFKTFVIANTNLLTYETYLSKGCDSLFAFNNVIKGGEIVSGDKTIVHLIDSLVQSNDKLFIMCQFYGNHSFYTNYERDFDVYHPNSNDPGVGNSKEALTNAYDNSILYQDYILSSIIDVISCDSAHSAMIFVSDHGEGIEEGGGGHGGDCNPSKSEYHVPFIFWCSDAYNENRPEKLNAARLHKTAKINGDNVFYTACSMAGIKIDTMYLEPTWDILSSEFKEHERLVLVPDGVNTINPDK